MKFKKGIVFALSLVLLLITALPLVTLAEEEPEPALKEYETITFGENETARLYQLGESKKKILFGPETSMGYIIAAKSGEIVVIDGGNAEDGEEIVDILHSIGGEKPTVSAWYLTHAHSDHYMAFVDAVKNHGDEFTIEKVFYDFPDHDTLALYENGAPTAEGAYIYQFYDISETVASVYEKTLQNDIRSYGHISVEPIFVPGVRLNESENLNDTSTVLRVEIEGQSIIFLGDLNSLGDELVEDVQEEKLNADVCQMAHHGQFALNKSVYEAISPKCCLWPTCKWVWNNEVYNQGVNSFILSTIETRRWATEIGITHNVVSVNGTGYLSFPLDFEDDGWGIEKMPSKYKPQMTSTGKLDFSDKFIINFGSTVESFLRNIEVVDGISGIDGKNNIPKEEISIIGTGDKLVISDNEGIPYYRYSIVSIGDINGDGESNVLDILSVKRAILELDKLSDNDKIAADINGDGNIDVLDILEIKRYILGYTSYPGEKAE